MPHYSTVGVVFTWVLLTLFLFRITRFITTDTFPPMLATRNWIEHKLTGHWDDLIVCNWCVGFYVCAIGYLVAAQLLSIPLPVLQAGATMAVVGFVGNYDD